MYLPPGHPLLPTPLQWLDKLLILLLLVQTSPSPEVSPGPGLVLSLCVFPCKNTAPIRESAHVPWLFVRGLSPDSRTRALSQHFLSGFHHTAWHRACCQQLWGNWSLCLQFSVLLNIQTSKEIYRRQWSKCYNRLCVCVGAVDCCRLNVCVSLKFVGWNLNAHCDDIRRGCCQRCLGHEDGALMNGINALMKETPQSSFVRIQEVCDWKRVLT